MRLYRDVVSGLDFLAGGKANSISLNNLLGHGLGGGRAGEAGEGVDTSGIGILLKLRVRGGLPSRRRRGIGAVLRRSYEARSRTRNERPRLQPRARAGIEGNGSPLEASQVSESGCSDGGRKAHMRRGFSFRGRKGKGLINWKQKDIRMQPWRIVMAKNWCGPCQIAQFRVGSDESGEVRCFPPASELVSWYCRNLRPCTPCWGREDV